MSLVAASSTTADDRTSRGPEEADVRPRWIFVTWYPYCRRSDALAEQLGATSYLVHYLRFKSPLIAPIKYILQALRTFGILLRTRPAGVLVANPPVVAPLVIWLGSLFLRYRFIIDTHSGAFQHARWRWTLPLQRFLARRAEATIITNDYLAGIIRSWGARTFLVQDLTLNLKRGVLESTRDGFHVVFICTYSVDEPVEAVVDAAGRLPDVTFSFTGDPSYAPRRVTRALPSNVRLTGFLPDADYLDVLRSADAVLALTEDDHTMQRGAYEALALEKPLIISDWPLLRQVFSRGTIHTRNTAEAIAQAIRAAKADLPNLRREITVLKSQRAVVSDSQVDALRRFCQGALSGKGA